MPACATEQIVGADNKLGLFRMRDSNDPRGKGQAALGAVQDDGRLEASTNIVNSSLGHIANLFLKRRWLVLLCSAGRRASVGQGIDSW